MKSKRFVLLTESFYCYLNTNEWLITSLEEEPRCSYSGFLSIHSDLDFGCDSFSFYLYSCRRRVIYLLWLKLFNMFKCSRKGIGFHMRNFLDVQKDNNLLFLSHISITFSQLRSKGICKYKNRCRQNSRKPTV
jgi:hypothetical protein